MLIWLKLKLIPGSIKIVPNHIFYTTLFRVLQVLHHEILDTLIGNDQNNNDSQNLLPFFRYLQELS